MLYAAIDRIMATSDQKANARTRAEQALAGHGAGASQYLRGKLGDPRRRRSRREIRLAIALIDAQLAGSPVSQVYA